MSTFDLERVHAAVRGTMFQGKLHHFPVIDSTNTCAVAEAHAGAEAGHVYIADEQTAGRGRGGHTWHSEPDRGLYVSVLLRPALHHQDVLKLSLLSGLVVYAAIHQVTGVRIDLRWPNDVVSSPALGPTRKLGGILAEAALTPDGNVRHAVVGIGINLNQSAFPLELQAAATSLRLVFGAPVSREAVAGALLVSLHDELRQFALAGGGSGVLERFSQISSWVHGKHVHVDEDGGYTGVTTGLTQEGLLRVRCLDGHVRLVRHGGVREAQPASQCKSGAY